MIDTILPTEAPHGEPLTRVRDRLVCWTLRHRLLDHPAIEALACLYDRRIMNDEPRAEQWMEARLDLDRSLALALALALIALLGSRLAPISRLDSAILDAVEVQHLFGLEMGSYHGEACGTTHCRAGSAIVLHPIGRELEQVFGSWLAGAVIYRVSTGRVPDFFATNEEALADMRACAAQQVAQ